MARSAASKLIQKKIYDILSDKYILTIFLFGMTLILVSAFQFGEAVVEWSRDKYTAVVESYMDNLKAKSFRTELCSPLPVDIVYTWVNGSDLQLLQELRAVKSTMEKQHNRSRFHGTSASGLYSSTNCPFQECVPAFLVVVEPNLPSYLSLETMKLYQPAFSNATAMLTLRASKNHSVTVLEFPTPEEAQSAVKSNLIMNGLNHSVLLGHWTVEDNIPNSPKMNNILLLTKLKFNEELMNEEKVKEKIPAVLRNHMEKMAIYESRGRIAFKLTSEDALKEFWRQPAANQSKPDRRSEYRHAYLVWEFSDEKSEDMAPSRYADNEELRYSLRSLEKFAPWVRRVFVVTNGQIPYWLNLDSPRMTLVTHKEIFPNSSHLPTFSSPAIESHLHRIKGLSERFIYFNDDVLLGKPVWPDDFFTHTRGQKVYLSWSVPNCAEGCPNSWIRDSYCDKSCNVSDCEWDGGDCTGANVRMNFYGAGRSQGGLNKIGTEPWFCNLGCSNTWIADKFCDQSCNVKQCAFDAGDCGIASFGQLAGFNFQPGQTKYTVPPGELSVYLNFTHLLGESGKIKEGDYADDRDTLRNVAIAKKFNVVVFVFKPNVTGVINASVLLFNGNITDTHAFTVHFNTTVSEQQVIPSLNRTSSEQTDQPLAAGDSREKVTTPTTTTTTTTVAPFKAAPDGLRLPKTVFIKWNDDDIVSENNSSVAMPQPLVDQLETLKAEYEKGLWSRRGYDRRRSMLIHEYLSSHHLDSTEQAGLKPQRQLLFAGGVVPWERIYEAYEEGEEEVVDDRHEANNSNEVSFHSRRLLDTYGDSLRHVNRIYTRVFGWSDRKAIAHMPHWIDRRIMQEAQNKFAAEWEATSSRKVRHAQDMQFAFSYFYFMMSEPKPFDVGEIFDEFDTDRSRTWSDREIRTLVTRLYDGPIDLKTLNSFEALLTNCSQYLNDSIKQQEPPPSTPAGERYIDSDLPIITRSLVINCDDVVQMMKKKINANQKKYRHELISEDEVFFKMVGTNTSTVVSQLDEIRKRPRKFICLNDNIDHKDIQASMVKLVLRDFYESMFPEPSQFELPADYRNRFLHVDELRKWQDYRNTLRIITYSLLAALILFALMSFFERQVEQLKRLLLPARWTRRRGSRLENV